MKKIILKLCTFLSILYPQTLPFVYTIYDKNNQETGIVIRAPLSQDKQTIKNFFNYACFHFFFLLEQLKIKQYKHPIILVIPENYTYTSPLDESAPLIEGSRVALAWASAYARFEKLGNLDIRIILCTTETNVENTIQKVLAEEIHTQTYSTPEEKIKNSFFKPSHDSTTQADIQLLPRSDIFQDQQPYTIKPQFNQAKTTPRILITGGAGFIGSHLAEYFVNKNYEVIVLDNLQCCTGLNISHLKNKPNFVFVNIDVSKPFDVEGPIDIMAHFASIPSPVAYYAMPIETLTSGLNGTRNCLDLCVRKKARFILASTSEVYGDPEINPQPEDYPGMVDPIGKRSQYDQSKRGAETIAKLYFDDYGFDIRIARIFNTYGPGMQPHDGRVITNFISAVLENKEMTIYGTGNQTRSPIYISDMVDGIVSLIENDAIAAIPDIKKRVFNVGNPEELSINQIASIVDILSLAYTGKKTPITYIPQFDHTDPKLRNPDISYINHITGFHPKIDFNEGLEKTFLHYKKLSEAIN